MFYDHLKQLLKELNVENAGAIPRDISTISLQLEGTPIELTDAQPGLELRATVGAIPDENAEKLFVKLLRGNFLGQATRRAILGLDAEGKQVVINSSIPVIRSYREFREVVEDFVNAVSFWKGEMVTYTP